MLITQLRRYILSNRYDTVSFAFWLTHVPPGRFEQFWSLVDQALAPSGRAIFVYNAIPLEVAIERLDKPAGLERQSKPACGDLGRRERRAAFDGSSPATNDADMVCGNH